MIRLVETSDYNITKVVWEVKKPYEWAPYPTVVFLHYGAGTARASAHIGVGFSRGAQSIIMLGYECYPFVTKEKS